MLYGGSLRRYCKSVCDGQTSRFGFIAGSRQDKEKVLPQYNPTIGPLQCHQSLLEQWLQSSLLLWIHLAPVCGAASRARDIRVFPGDPQPLRNNCEPEGLSNLQPEDARRVSIANTLLGIFLQALSFSLVPRNLGDNREPTQLLLLDHALGFAIDACMGPFLW